MNKNRARAATAIAALLIAAACASLAAWSPRIRASRAQTGGDAAPRAPESRAATESRAAIYGRAVSEATGKPLRRARIQLMMLDGSRVDRDALTDTRGEFRIGNLPAGRYVVWAEVSGMVTPEGFQPFRVYTDASPDPETMRRHFEVVELDGKAEREVLVRARRGGVITGRVTYADGDPAVGAPVHLLDRRGGLTALSADLSMASGAGLRTDDRGVYRVAGLPPGEYLVAVSEWADHAGQAEGPEGHAPMISDRMQAAVAPRLLRTYHPSASSAKKAAAVVVGAGEEHSGIDVTLPDRELRTVAGVARAARGGRPIRGAAVYISLKGGGADDDPAEVLGGADTRADAEGRWQLREVPDGLYTLYVSPPVDYESGGGEGNENAASMNMNAPLNGNASLPVPPRPRRKFAPVRRDLRVSGDVAEFVVELGEGGRISGTAFAEAGKEVPYAVMYAVPAAQLTDTALPTSPSDGRVEGDAFELEGLAPGKYFLHLKIYTKEGVAYPKSLTWQGKDLLREPLEVGEGTRIEGVRAVIGFDPALLRVRVSGAGNKPAPNVNVFLLPADLSQWSLSPSQLFCATGGEGFCLLTAPPGDYLVVTARAFDQLKDVGQELRRRALNAPRVTLRPKEEKSVETVIKEQ